MRVFVLQRGCWTEWTIIAQTTIPRTRSLCSGLSTAHWPHPLLTDHIHSSLTTSTAHWPHPHLTDHIHSSLTIQTYIHTNLYSAKNHENASEALTYFFHLSLSSVILTDSSTRSPVPVHVLMLFFILSESPAFTAVCCYRSHWRSSLVVSSLKSVCCDFPCFPKWCPDRLPFRCTLTIFCNWGPKVWERIHLLQLFILNEYVACYAVARHYLGLVDVDE